MEASISRGLAATCFAQHRCGEGPFIYCFRTPENAFGYEKKGQTKPILSPGCNKLITSVKLFPEGRAQDPSSFSAKCSLLATVGPAVESRKSGFIKVLTWERLGPLFQCCCFLVSDSLTFRHLKTQAGGS